MNCTEVKLPNSIGGRCTGHVILQWTRTWTKNLKHCQTYLSFAW